MVFFGSIKTIIWNNFCDDWLPPDLLRLERLDHTVSGLALRLVVGEDDRSILSPHIGALPIEGRGVMDREKHFQQALITHKLRVERDLDDLGVTR
jgi:hypothetical protein